MSTEQAPPDAGLTVQFGREGALLARAMAVTGLVVALTNAFLIWQIASLGFLAAGFASPCARPRRTWPSAPSRSWPA
jgi:hypothetical protein